MTPVLTSSLWVRLTTRLAINTSAHGQVTPWSETPTSGKRSLAFVVHQAGGQRFPFRSSSFSF